MDDDCFRVKIFPLGKSKSGYIYSEKVLQKTVPLFSGLPIIGIPNFLRPFEDTFDFFIKKPMSLQIYGKCIDPEFVMNKGLFVTFKFKDQNNFDMFYGLTNKLIDYSLDFVGEVYENSVTNIERIDEVFIFTTDKGRAMAKSSLEGSIKKSGASTGPVTPKPNIKPAGQKPKKK